MSPLAFVALAPAPTSTRGLKEEASNRFSVSRNLMRPRDAKLVRKQEKVSRRHHDTENVPI